MNKIGIIRLITGGLLVGLLSGCATRMGDFTMISTKNVDPSRVAPNQPVKRVQGVDRTHYVFFVPLGAPSLEEAVDKAVEQAPGAVGLADAVIYYKWWWLFYYGQSSVVVEGTPLMQMENTTSVSEK